MLTPILSRLHRAAQRGQVKRASAAYVVTDGIIRAAQGMRKQAQEPQNMPVPRVGNWRQYLPADPLLVATLQGKRLSGNTSRMPRAGNWRQSDPLLVATLQGKRLSGNTSRRVMDFGRKAWNTFQHMPVVGTKSPPTINDADVARLRYYQPPKSHPASPTGQLSTGTPYLNRFFKADKPNALQSFPQFSWEIRRPKYPTEKYLGTRELPFKPRPSASAPWQFHAPKTDEFGVPKFKLDTKDYARDMSPADRAMTLGVLADVSPFPLTRVAARLNALALAPAEHKRWSQETSARDYVDWLTAQRQQK
jgi:hypothetical protein